MIPTFGLPSPAQPGIADLESRINARSDVANAVIDGMGDALLSSMGRRANDDRLVHRRLNQTLGSRISNRTGMASGTAYDLNNALANRMVERNILTSMIPDNAMSLPVAGMPTTSYDPDAIITTPPAPAVPYSPPSPPGLPPPGGMHSAYADIVSELDGSGCPNPAISPDINFILINTLDDALTVQPSGMFNDLMVSSPYPYRLVGTIPVGDPDNGEGWVNSHSLAIRAGRKLLGSTVYYQLVDCTGKQVAIGPVCDTFNCYIMEAQGLIYGGYYNSMDPATTLDGHPERVDALVSKNCGG